MGCENSKTVRVLPVGKASLSRDNTQEGATQTPEAKTKHPHGSKKLHQTASELTLDEQGNKVKSAKKSKRSKSGKDRMGSCDSLDCDSDSRSIGSDRGFSATSKQSADSGLGDDYAHVITEYSSENRVKEVEGMFKARDDLEMGITGVQVGTRNSAKDRARQEEAHIMQSLREEGLITKPKAENSGGMCFEIVDASGDGLPKPPPRLEKLSEKRRGKKAALTKEEIREKLERAELRRKKREQERLDKLKVMERTDAIAALENFTQYQKSKEETIAQRMDQVENNRERQLRELRERQERRKKHAEEVRKRKAQAKENGISNEAFESEEYPPTPRDGPTTPHAEPQTPREGLTTPRAEPEVTLARKAESKPRVRSPIQVQEVRERRGSKGSHRSRDGSESEGGHRQDSCRVHGEGGGRGGEESEVGLLGPQRASATLETV